MGRAVLAACVAVAACGSEVAPVRLPGSPAATRALAFDDQGTPVAIGGESAFGLAYLQTRDGDTWLRADGIAAFDAHAILVGGRSRPLYALGETQLHRLVDPARFTWETFAIPVGTTPDTAFGIDDAGAVYAVELAADGGGAVLAWKPGDARWTEVPGSRPIGVGATSFVVEGDGRLTWSVPATGIVRLEGGTQSTLVDCAEPALGACTTALRSLAVDDADTLTFLVCVQEEGGPRAVVRVAPGDDPRTIAIEDARCDGIATIADGTSLLAADALYVLERDGEQLERLVVADPALTYVLRDSSTAFAYGDGIYQIEF